MARAEREQRALRRELLLVRAAAQRAALVAELDSLKVSASTARSGLGGLLLKVTGALGNRHAYLLNLFTKMIRMARQHPWIISAVAGGAARLLRSRSLHWGVLAAVAAAGIWWLQRQGEKTASDSGVSRPYTD
ncbi:MAG: hypothetical protein FD187_2213 [bacterium]|nr:MAG: hypothetical protein FD142_2588 [bacterium]KAF0148102.1 MAG: hypothetical protein FD187_2213 [bacterium]KAF0167632.1 MAG: hypothetical protein FD158_2108 [bacterium]TXT19458.1 MAG: hypothetical protein FD132_1727 [bacterium]